MAQTISTEMQERMTEFAGNIIKSMDMDAAKSDFNKEVDRAMRVYMQKEAKFHNLLTFDSEFKCKMMRTLKWFL